MDTILISFVILLTFARQEIYSTSIPIKMPAGIVCKLGQELCGRKCFTPLSEICLTYEDGSGPIICRAGDTFCGGQCLLPFSGKFCVPFEHHNYNFTTICDIGQLVCGYNKCYSPDIHECFRNEHLCLGGQQLCGETCYTPSKSVHCFEKDQWGSNYLCPAGHDVCALRGCYNPDHQVCYSDKNQVCELWEQICGDWFGTCYNVSAGKICLKNTTVCKIEEHVCGTTCFDPIDGKTCFNETIVCDGGMVNCGEYTCYSPASGEQCFNQAGTSYYGVCKPGQKFCGSKCFDPSQEACFDDGSVCPIGKELCNFMECFDPVTESCEDSGNGKVVCLTDEDLCGRHCLKPGTGEVCIQDEVICKDGEKLCAEDLCYNPTTQKCFDVRNMGGNSVS